MSSTVPTVHLGSIEIKLVPPTSYSIRYETSISAANNQLRAFAAALGLCSATAGKRDKLQIKARYTDSFNPLQYGGEVLDELVARGYTTVEVMAAGVVAYGVISDGVFHLTEEAVEATADFSDPKPEDSTLRS